MSAAGDNRTVPEMVAQAESSSPEEQIKLLNSLRFSIAGHFRVANEKGYQENVSLHEYLQIPAESTRLTDTQASSSHQESTAKESRSLSGKYLSGGESIGLLLARDRTTQGQLHITLI